MRKLAAVAIQMSCVFFFLAAIRAFIEIESRKLYDARVATIQTDITLLNRLIVDLKIDLNVILWRVTEVTDVDHEIIEILLPKDRPACFNIRDGDVGRRIVTADVERRELRVVR